MANPRKKDKGVCWLCGRPITRTRRNNQLHYTLLLPCQHMFRDQRDVVLSMLDEGGWTLDSSGAVPLIKGGTFDGQPLYVPYFWQKEEHDHLEERGGRTVFVHLIGETDPIRKVFPELGQKTAVRLWMTPDLHFVEEL